MDKRVLFMVKVWVAAAVWTMLALFAASPLADPLLRGDPQRWLRGVVPLAAPRASASATVALRSDSVAADLPASPALLPVSSWQPPPLGWNQTAPQLPDIADRVHDEIGFDVAASEFSSPGSLDTLWSWMGAVDHPGWLRSSVRSAFTPLGTDVDVDLYLRWDDWRVALALWSQSDGSRTFPGLNLELFEYPLLTAPRPILVTPRVSLWSQPVSRFSGAVEWGGLGSLVVEVPVQDNLWFWLESRAKSAGWALGAQDSAARLSVRTGFHWSL